MDASVHVDDKLVPEMAQNSSENKKRMIRTNILRKNRMMLLDVTQMQAGAKKKKTQSYQQSAKRI